MKEFSTLVEIKAAHLRKALYVQSDTAIDRGIHIGGAQSAILPMAALYYGGSYRYNVEQPADENQDAFILSKGHAVAALASVYADVGYIPRAALRGSRSLGAMIKGHPGPIIPGVPVATGPLGHGIGIACGFAFHQKERGDFCTYTLVGDGELQEGSCWESLLFAAQHKLNNLCVIVDKNNGQSDDTKQLFVGYGDLGEKFRAFGFHTLYADQTNVAELLSQIESFASWPRCTQPTVIICEGYKGFGGFSIDAGLHKSTVTAEEAVRETEFLERRCASLINSLNNMNLEAVKEYAGGLGLKAEFNQGKLSALTPAPKDTAPKKAVPRQKAVNYDKKMLPNISLGQSFAPTDLGIAIAQSFANSDNFYTVDADLSNVSGLYSGTIKTNRSHAINAGIAECHMMNMAEGLAAMGANCWVSTFGPFFNLQSFRRIAVSYQERAEAIEDGWLNEGHNLDITFLATGSNLDLAVNGATHIGNDDINIFGQLANVKVIDTSCPQQFLAVAKWIAEGNKGLVYMRVMRNATPALYGYDYQFRFGKGYFVKGDDKSAAVIVSSGHGVLEAVATAELLEKDGISIAVVDMPSYDAVLLEKLSKAGSKLLFAEHNNGWLFDSFARDCLLKGLDTKNVRQLSTKNSESKLQYLHSGTYGQLLESLNLNPESMAQKMKGWVT